MNNEIHNLRIGEQFREALAAVGHALEVELNSRSSPDLPLAESWRRHITGSRCLILECARSLRARPSQ